MEYLDEDASPQGYFVYEVKSNRSIPLLLRSTPQSSFRAILSRISYDDAVDTQGFPHPS